MTVWHRLLSLAAQRIAADPRVRAKAAAVVEREIGPRVGAAIDKARPRLVAAREELRDLAAEINPRQDPVGFARRLGRRVREVARDGD